MVYPYIYHEYYEASLNHNFPMVVQGLHPMLQLLLFSRSPGELLSIDADIPEAGDGARCHDDDSVWESFGYLANRNVFLSNKPRETRGKIIGKS